MATKNFPIATVLSMTTGSLLCQMDDLYEIAEHIAGGPVFTHELIDKRWPQAILDQYPQLKDVVKYKNPDEGSFPTRDAFRAAVQENIKAYVADAETKYGKELPIQSLAA